MIRPILALVTAIAMVAPCTATTLPVGPITFSTNSEYDSNFKESPVSFNGIFRNAAGSLELFGSPTAIAIFDMSASGGSNGFGGISGSDLNNDLSNFTISADFASNNASGIGGGFLLRLNSAEGNGYAASVHSVGTQSVVFQVNEASGIFGAGPTIFSTNVPLGFTLAPNTFYNFKVTVTGGLFQFNFASTATASFTDTTVSATVGQVGIIMDTFSPNATQYLDNFLIVPEPTSAILLCSAAFSTLLRLRRVD